MRRRAKVAVAGLAAVVVLAGCAVTAEPDGWAAPVTDGDTVIAHVTSGQIAALRLSGTGTTEVWRYPTSAHNVEFSGIYATPILDRGVVYIASYDGKVAAIDASNGNHVSGWGQPVDLRRHIVATPAYDGERLYVPTEDGDIYVINAADGSRAGVLLSGAGRIWGEPVLRDGALYAADLDQRTVYALNLPSGDLRWEHALPGAVAGDLTANGNMLLVGSFDRAIHALDLGTGQERWRHDGDGWIVAAPLVEGDTIFAASMRGSVYALDAVDGTLLWEATFEDAEFRARPALVGGTLVVAARDGRVLGLNGSNGSVHWEAQEANAVFHANPLVLDGEQVILYLTDRGDLVRVNPSDGALQRLATSG